MATSVNTSTQQYFGFDPRTIPTCILWLDGADSNTLFSDTGRTTLATLGGTVLRWNDKSGFSNHVTASSGTTTLTASAINGVPALSFANSWFTGGFSSTYTGNQLRGFGVATLASASGLYPRIFTVGRPGVNDFDNTTTTFLFIRNNGGQNLMVGRSTGANYLTVSIPAYSTPFLVQAGHDSNIESIAVNGALTPSSLNTGITTNFNITSYGIGTNTNTADVQNFTGLVGEIIYYTENLTTAQIRQVEGYLAWKWGLQANLPVGHAFKYNPTTLRVFQPIDINTCRLWLDAADASTVQLSGSSVSNWIDKSGSGLNFSQATSAQQPTYSVGTLNGRNGILFTGAGTNGAATLTLSNASFTLTQGAYSIFAVARQNASSPSYTGYNYLLKGSLTDGFLFFGNHSSKNFATFTSPNSTTWNDTNSNSPPVSTSNNPLLLGMTVSNTVLTPYYSGIAQNTKTGTTGAFTGMVLGDAPFPTFSGQNWNGVICEICIFNSVLTTSQRLQLEGYLTDKWRVAALPTTHPYSLQRALPSTPIFIPTSLSDCSLWVDAADPAGTGVRPANGSSVATWVDKSGTPNNMTATGTVTYQDSPSRLVMSSSSMSATFSYGANTLFIVYNQTGTSGPVFTTNNVDVTGLFPNEGGTTFFARSDTAWASQASTLPTSTINLISVQYADIASGSAMNLWLNGVLNISSTTSGTITRNRLTLAVRSFNNQFMAGNYHEVILYNRSLTVNERQQIEGYLAWKWGRQNSLPTTHPYYKSRP